MAPDPKPGSEGHSGDRVSRGSPLDRPIALAAPLLDLLLWAGERLSRLVEPVDHEHYPVRDDHPEGADGGEDRNPDDR